MTQIITHLSQPIPMSVELLIEAMKRDQCVSFQYDGKTRIVEVHAIGYSPKDGSIVFRAFQVGGDASRPLPVWTLFTLDKVTALMHQQRISDAPRDGYAMDDRQMVKPLIAEIKL